MKSKKTPSISSLLVFFLFVQIAGGCRKSGPPAYRNPDLSAEKRASDLLSRMTLEEKIGQIRCGNDLKRLPEYADKGFGAPACVLRNNGPREAAEQRTMDLFKFSSDSEE